MKANFTWPCVVLATGFTLAMAVQAQDIYRWVGEDGTVSYGHNPPPGVDAEALDTAPSTPSSPEAAEDTDAQPVPAEEEPGRADRGFDEEQLAALEQECLRARENLAVLEDPAVRRIQADNGEAETLTDERRQELLQENRDFVDEWCD